MHIFLETFSKYISPDDILILAVSGWVDSMVLFDILKKHHPKEKLVVVHFDHSLRWDESDADRELVANICKSENIICEVEKMDIWWLAKTEKKSIEHIAREERYRFFRQVKEKYSAKYILTAHHADDQVETILMGMGKWGKIRGLSGMSIASGDIFRPLLSIRKEELYQYARENALIYREDMTNMDTDFERNHVRQNIVPLFRKINPTIDETLGELGQYMQELTDYIEKQVIDWLTKSANISEKEHSFFRQDFLGEAVFFQREIIAYLYHLSHDGSTQWLSRWNIEECIRFIREASNSHGIKEIKNLRLERRGERVYY
jgi:tRNA(Ile)-lysidine synthase